MLRRTAIKFVPSIIFGRVLAPFLSAAPSSGSPVAAEEAKPSITEAVRALPGLSKFRSDPYLRLAARLQEMGEGIAIAELALAARELAHRDDDKIIILCRMLFAPKPGESFCRPMIGAPAFLGRTTAAQWPLEPISVVDGIPILVVHGYTLGGRAQPAGEYLEYCRKSCEWSSESFKPADLPAREAAVEKLLSSTKWTRPLTRDERIFFLKQAR